MNRPTAVGPRKAKAQRFSLTREYATLRVMRYAAGLESIAGQLIQRAANPPTISGAFQHGR
jgi:hypothetical protein